MEFTINELNLTVQIILISIIIIQTSYIGSTMRFNRRLTQYDLTHEWRQKLTKTYLQSGIIPNISDEAINTNEVQELIDTFSDMHSLFRDKLLKSSDFIPQFVRLHTLVITESKKQTDVFKSNHIQLQLIYNDFNKVDVVMEMLNYVDIEILDSIKEKLGKNTIRGLGVDAYKKNYVKWFVFLKLVMWYNIKIKKTSFFKLPLIE